MPSLFDAEAMRVFSTLGLILFYGGGVTTFAYWLFKMLGEKWLSSKFEEKLERFRHEQAQEMEQLKFRINALLDRTMKLHQREFEVLPEAWAKMAEAYGNVQAFISPLQQYPDIEHLNAEQLAEFLQSTPLSSSERNELARSQDRNKYYQERVNAYRHAEVRQLLRESYLYLLKNGIFIAPTIREQFSQMDQMLFDAAAEHEFNRHARPVPRHTQAADKLKSVGAQLIKDLEASVQTRLWSKEESGK